MSLIILQVIPSPIGYIIIVLNFNCATWSFFSKHNFRRWANLMSNFLVISFLLEHQTWFRVYVTPLVSITFCFIIIWLDGIADRLHLHEILRQMCREHHQHSELFQDIYWILDEKYHPLLSIICVIIDHFIAFHLTQTCSCFVLYLEILAIQQLLFFTLEYYHLLCQECCENFTTSYEFFLVWYFSSILPIHRFWVVVNREHWIPFARHPFSGCCRYSMTSYETSRHNVSWSSSALDFYQVLIGFIVRNTILTPRWFVLSSATSLDSLPIQIW